MAKQKKKETDIVRIIGRYMAKACPIGSEPELLAGLQKFMGPKQDAKRWFGDSILEGFADRQQ